MALSITDDVKNAMLDQIENIIGTSAILKIRTGAPPASITDADTGTVLATLNLPSDWMDAASGGIVEKLGTWEDATPDAAGVAGHFRIYESDGTTQKIQGTVGISSSNDMKVNNVNVDPAYPFEVIEFKISL